MRELNEPRWAVINHRGCLADGFTYDQAWALAKHMWQETRTRTTVVPDETAERLGSSEPHVYPK